MLGSQCCVLGPGFRDRFSVLGTGFMDRVLSAGY